MFSPRLYMHHTAFLSPFEPDIYDNKITQRRSLDDILPSCVYIGVEKSQHPPPSEGHRWILFWRVVLRGEEYQRVVQAVWAATGKGTVTATLKKPEEIPSDLVTFCLGHLDRRELDRLYELALETTPLPRSNARATYREWVARVACVAVKEGLLEEEDMQRGVIAGLAVNW